MIKRREFAKTLARGAAATSIAGGMNPQVACYKRQTRLKPGRTFDARRRRLP